MSRFRVNEPNVVFEAFDEEVVLVNLETGNYYSLRGCGPQVWLALAGGATVEETAAALGGKPGAETGVLGQVTALAGELQAAELLAPSDADGPKDGALVELSRLAVFEPPLLERYDDMQDLLMLDPIHEVDPAGWPLAKDA